MEATTKTLARINKVDILLVENGEKLIPIKPICEALGVDDKAQKDKIKNDEILGSTGVLSTSVGADGKDREMFYIPFKYVFGWLFSINPKNVAPEAREAVLNYKSQCYDVLYNHFTAHSQFYEEKQQVLRAKYMELERIRAEFNTAKDRLEQAKKEFKETMNMSFEEWQASKQQLKIEFEDGREVNFSETKEVTNG